MCAQVDQSRIGIFKDLPSPPPFLTSIFSLPSSASYYSPPDESEAPKTISPTDGLGIGAGVGKGKGQRPRVTLTFAQSLDAKIAGKGGSQVLLSGKESMVMTHWMRTMHDGILIGIGTALNDDPQLNTRHLPPLVSPSGSKVAYSYHLPRPIILDTHLRLSPSCKLLTNWREGRGRRPWVFCSSANTNISTKKVLEDAGAKVWLADAGTESSGSNKLLLPSVLQVLYDNGIKSLMVEGGAGVIGSFLAMSLSDSSTTLSTFEQKQIAEGQEGEEEGKLLEDKGTVDTLIITIAPRILGGEAVGYGGDLAGSQMGLRLRHLGTEVMGRDVVVGMRVG